MVMRIEAMAIILREVSPIMPTTACRRARHSRSVENHELDLVLHQWVSPAASHLRHTGDPLASPRGKFCHVKGRKHTDKHIG